MAAVPPPFALSPALVDAGGVIDYSTAAGKKIYAGATKSLADDSDSLYDGSAENLSAFLHRLKVRAMEYGWLDGGILDVDTAPGAAVPVLVNLIEKYGDLTLTQVRDHVTVYSGVQNRAAQDCMQLFHCIMKSLTNDAINKVKNKFQDYTVAGTPSGVLLVKVLVREAHLDTNATVSRIRTEIANLDQYMVKIKGNVTKFNLHVEDLVTQLTSRGQESQELLHNLFQAYKMCNDEPFVRYIEAKEKDYDDGELVTPEEIMLVAGNKYQTRVDKGEWQAPSQSQTQIIALKAEVKKLRSNNKTKTKSKRMIKKKGEKSKTNAKGKPEWMTKPPTDAEKRAGNQKKMDGKTYHWCQTHKSWGRHKASECRGLNYNPRIGTQHETTNPTTQQLVQQEVVQEPTNDQTDEAEYESDE